ARGEGFRDDTPRELGVLHVGEAFVSEQRVGNVLGRPADAGALDQPESRRLGRRLGGGRVGAQSQTPRGPRHGDLSKELSPAPHGSSYPFSSFFSSLRKRQSVPSAISFCGLPFTIPASRRRSA